jgi:hypothetical protein
VFASIAIGFAVAVLGFVLGSGLVQALSPLEPSEPEEETAKEQAFLEFGGAESVAEKAADLFWDRERWVHRRVEQIAFLDTHVVRRRISIDLEIPVAGGEGAPSDGKWLPLSVLRNWPPVLSFDLRDETGRTLPLVSKVSTNLLDEQILMGVARQALGNVPSSLQRHLRSLVHGESTHSHDSLTAIRTSLNEWAEEHQEEAKLEELNRLVDLAGVLADRTLLWVKIAGTPGDRRILKLAYDEPTRKRLSPVRDFLTTIGFFSLAVDFEVPHIGDSGSYHLDVQAPDGLGVVAGDLLLPDGGHGQSWWKRAWRGLISRVAQAWAPIVGPAGSDSYPLVQRHHVQVLTQRVHIYLSGRRARSEAAAYVRFLPHRSGTITTCALVTVLAAAVMSGFDATATQLLNNRDEPGVFGAVVAFLLLVPGLLGYVLLHPAGEHPFVTRILAGARALAGLGLLLPVAAAALLLAAVIESDPDKLTWREPLMWMSWGIAAQAVIAWLIPRRYFRARD